MSATWRVVWGSSRFLRLNEFASEEHARSFVATLAAVDLSGRAIRVRVERRVDGKWVEVHGDARRRSP